MKHITAVLVLSVVAMSAAADSIISDIMRHLWWDGAEQALRIRYAVEELGADVEGGVKDGDPDQTPLCQSARLEASQELVRLGAEIRGSGDGSYTLLECAIDYGADDPRLIEWAISELGQELNVLDEYGESPLCKAARNVKAATIQTLLDAGADPNLRSDHDRSTHPLACALSNNNEEWSEVEAILDTLTAAGAVMPKPN